MDTKLLLLQSHPFFVFAARTRSHVYSIAKNTQIFNVNVLHVITREMTYVSEPRFKMTRNMTVTHVKHVGFLQVYALLVRITAIVNMIRSWQGNSTTLAHVGTKRTFYLQTCVFFYVLKTTNISKSQIHHWDVKLVLFCKDALKMSSARIL